MQPYEKVIVRNRIDQYWRANWFSHITNNPNAKYACLVNDWKYCLPYKNNEKYLGTVFNPVDKYDIDTNIIIKSGKYANHRGIVINSYNNKYVVKIYDKENKNIIDMEIIDIDNLETEAKGE